MTNVISPEEGMSAISERDFKTILDCIGRLYEVENLDQFPSVALTEILRVVGADSSTFNYVAPSVPKVVTFAIPEIPDEKNRTARFAHYLPEHEPLNYFLATGDPRAVKISDFQSVREYHNLPLYQEFYRELEYEDQFTFMLFLPGAELIGISLARSRRSFTERDRQILDFLRPYVARAYRHVERVGLVNRALADPHPGANAMRVTSMILDERDRPVHFSAEAQRWIHEFFPDKVRSGSHLPDVICSWLRASESRTSGAGARSPGREPLVVEKETARLRLSLVPGTCDRGRILVLSLETVPNRANLKPYRLTKREVEILLQVELGKTNGEISAALGISPLTVRCHLEHIFAKLKVPSRTAAVTRFRNISQGTGERLDF